MKTKKFLIQFEFDDRTRWLFGTGHLVADLEALASNLATAFTTGPRPAVTVTAEETMPPLTTLSHRHD
jgi:hypothetical protein